MGLLRDDSYDRARLLDAAAMARRRGRVRQAIELYQRVLAVEPKNPELQRRIAPLFADAGEPGKAWTSYRLAADEFVAAGFVEKAIGVYREAAQRMPRAPEAWLAVAELEAARARGVDAKLALLAGRRNLRTRKHRPAAARLLRRALELDPADFDSRVDLARVEAKLGQRGLAIALLGEALLRAPLRAPRIRFEQFRIAPSGERAWRWLCALARRATGADVPAHLAPARANTAPARRGVVLTERATARGRSGSPPFGESHWPVAQPAPLSR
jgi:tetratricopeptide (TPR) repeat protein